MSHETLQVLLVEDNEDHVFLTRRALQNSGLRLQIHIARDGEEALDFVRRRGLLAKAPRPDLILLDLQLPGKDGFEVLAELKSDPDLLSIPVVVLTSSAAESDVARGYNLGSNSYVTKPVRMEEMTSKLQQLTSYWARVNRRPPVHP